MNEAGEMDRSSIVARCKAAEMFEPPEASLNPIALLIEFGVLWDEDLAIAFSGRVARRLQPPPPTFKPRWPNTMGIC